MQLEVQEVQQEVKQLIIEIREIKAKVQSLSADVEQLEDDFDDLQQTLENINNNLWRNNIRMKGLKEGAEGNRVFLEEIFTASLGVDCEFTIQVTSAFRMGVQQSSITRPRDVIVKLPNWQTKSKILGIMWDQ